jgi:hypothetical protein
MYDHSTTVGLFCAFSRLYPQDRHLQLIREFEAPPLVELDRSIWAQSATN